MTVYGTAIYNGTSYTLYGRPGSTLRDELNRLANGGEYPAYTSYKDEDGNSLKFELDKLNAVPVENSVFRIPADYKMVSYNEYKSSLK